ncbi:MAG: hypothetical protein ACJAVZ_000066 [Afipia broomeae]|jgi:uncharacterized protein YhbP (UPF0306 family)
MNVNPIHALRLSTFAVSGLAMTNRLTLADVKNLQARARRHLPEDSGLRQAILTFHQDFPTVRFDRVRLYDLGANLLAALRRDCLPDAPDAHRVDIHG